MSAPTVDTSELRLGQMLADPITQAVMARDGLTSADVRDTLRRARRRLAEGHADRNVGHACERRL